MECEGRYQPCLRKGVLRIDYRMLSLEVFVFSLFNRLKKLKIGKGGNRFSIINYLFKTILKVVPLLTSEFFTKI